MVEGAVAVGEDWAELCAPYLHSVHGSAVTCLAQCSDPAPGLLDRLRQLPPPPPPARQFPVRGGERELLGGVQPALILTGHEDGSVKLWLSQDSTIALLTKLNTSQYFQVLCFASWHHSAYSGTGL